MKQEQMIEKIKGFLSTANKEDIEFVFKVLCPHSSVKGIPEEGAYCVDCKKDLGWYCDSSPTKTCAYDEEEDPSCDSCIYCGDPDERK